MVKKLVYTFFSALVIALCCAVLAVVWLFPKLSSVDSPYQSAALLALDRTPMEHVTRVLPFTGGEVAQTVVGTDAVGRTLYVMVQPNHTFTTLYADKAITESQAIHAAGGLNGTNAQVISAVPGLFQFPSPGAGRQAGQPVWQIILKLPFHSYLFSYVDMHTQQVLWHFTSNDTFHLWDQ